MKNIVRLLTVVFFGSALMHSFCAASQSVNEVDFSNLDFPFVIDSLPSVPNNIRLLDLPVRGGIVHLHNGRYTIPCDDDGPCPLLTLDSVSFGQIEGLPETSAFVVVTYHTGGTATWQYVYIIALKDRKPKVMAWMETGSRADMGLRTVASDHGDLVLVVNDPEKRMGDCCSTGSITYRYRWSRGSFVQAAAPVAADDSQ
jgi:hypothetical protein